MVSTRRYGLLAVGGVVCVLVVVGLMNLARHSAQATDTPQTRPAVPEPVLGTMQSKTNPFYYQGADPSAHVFGGKLYVYATIDSPDVYLRGSGNGMYKYHVLSTEDLSTWTDHGMILHLRDVPWAQSMLWAYDIEEKAGTYYLYFCANASNDTKGARPGIATGPSPTGLFKALPGYLKSSVSGQPDRDGIDPSVFKDDDGRYYLIWKTWGDSVKGETDPGNKEKIAFAKLKDNMRDFDGEVSVVQVIGVPNEGTAASRLFFEGPWLHKYKGTYYLSYPATKGGWDTEHIVYATSDKVAGPYQYRGQLLENDPKWNTNKTTHGSIVEFKRQ